MGSDQIRHVNEVHTDVTQAELRLTSAMLEQERRLTSMTREERDSLKGEREWADWLRLQSACLMLKQVKTLTSELLQP